MWLSAVSFPVRAHAWVVCQVPRWGRARDNRWMFLSHMYAFVPFSLPSLLSRKKERKRDRERERKREINSRKEWSDEKNVAERSGKRCTDNWI